MLEPGTTPPPDNVVQMQLVGRLIESSKQGDRHAFHELYKLHVARVYALCLRLTGQSALAEEATQEVFIQVWKKLGNYRGDSQFSTWLHSVASNVTISYLRSQKSFWQNLFNLEDSGADMMPAEESADKVDLDVYIARLPERARVVFVLHAIEGYRHEEIATMMNMAVGSSKAQFHRAKNLIKTWMGYADEDV